MNYLCFYKRPILHLGTRFHPLLTYSRTSSPQFSPFSYIIVFSCCLLNYSHSYTNTMQFLPCYNKNTVWIPHSPPAVTPFFCSKTLWKCYLCWLYPLPFLPFPLTHSIQDFPPPTTLLKLSSRSPVASVYLNLGLLWRRKWQPTPVFLPGKSRGKGKINK